MERRAIRSLLHRAKGEAVHRIWRAARVYGSLHPGSARSDRFGSLGEGCIISFPPASLYGERSIHIGEHTLVAPWATLAAGYAEDQPDVPADALVIGDRCVIGIRSGIVAHEHVDVGDDVWMGQDVFITDSNHGFSDLTTPFGIQLGDPEPVSIGSGTWIGHGAVILPGAKIGRNVVVAAGAVVRGTVEDYSVVAGVPARVLRNLASPTEA